MRTANTPDFGTGRGSSPATSPAAKIHSRPTACNVGPTRTNPSSVSANPVSRSQAGGVLASLVALGSVRLDPTRPWMRPAGWWQLGSCMVLYSATLSMALLALVLRFMHVRHPWADNLSDNAYGIYVVHYPFVVWTQYVLLGSSMPATSKAVIVFSVSLGLSWTMSALLRSIPGVRAVL